jgi:hypothetical protein
MKRRRLKERIQKQGKWANVLSKAKHFLRGLRLGAPSAGAESLINATFLEMKFMPNFNLVLEGICSITNVELHPNRVTAL